MTIDSSKVILPSVVPYGFGVMQDTVQANAVPKVSELPLVYMKPESADMVKQKADSDALTQPSTTQVAIGVDGLTPADKAKKKKKATKSSTAQVPGNDTAIATPQVQGGVQQTTTRPSQTQQSPTMGVQAPVAVSREVEQAPTVTDTPDTSSDAVPVSDERKRIHTLFQTLTGKDAIPYGEKWRWYLQHGFTGMHGGLHQELMNQINAETNAFGRGTKNTYGQELRAQEMKRKTLMQQWDKLLWEWNHGYYSGDESSVRKFHQNANRLRSAMIAEGITPDLIRDPSINAGGFAQGFQKDISNYRNKLDWLGGWMQTIEDNIAENPDWLNSTQATMEFDKMSEYVILNWAQSKGAIADAEKIRAQVEAMPEQDRAYYNGFMSQFFNGNAFVQMESLAQQGNQHAKELVAELKRLVNYDPEDAAKIGGEVKGAVGDRIMQLVELIRVDLAGNNLDLPIDLATAANSYKASKEAFDEYVMKNANVDRKMVWDSASDQLKIMRNAYDRLIQRGGLYQGWQYDGYNPDARFSDRLAQWQANDLTDSVIRNARLGMGSMAGDTRTGFNVEVRGGGAGTTGGDTKKERPKVPKALEGKNAWYEGGKWYYYNKGKKVQYGG